MQAAIKLNIKKLSEQVASLEDISKKKKWQFFYDSDLDQLYLTPDVVKKDCVLYSVNNEFSIYVDKQSNIEGVFVEYFKTNLSSHNSRFKAFNNIFTVETNGLETVSEKKQDKAEILKELVKVEMLSSLVKSHNQQVTIAS
ncbi:hypothetical protein C4559_00910 [Candidatus Microgenomates bacterium]|nr:MAG: hypothetical protein C4559_00910 [Candidatus Microgenomates bacterium]